MRDAIILVGVEPYAPRITWQSKRQVKLKRTPAVNSTQPASAGFFI
jgi:hypothetical protein